MMKVKQITPVIVGRKILVGNCCLIFPYKSITDPGI
jgi:hypothetical protein